VSDDVVVQLSLLCETITYCLLEPLAASIHPSSDHWILRDYAAYLLAITMRFAVVDTFSALLIGVIPIYCGRELQASVCTG